MPTRSAIVAQKAARLIRARGSNITLRRLSVSEAGPEPLPNPARSQTLTVRGSHIAGTNQLTLESPELVGRFVLGDTIDIPTVGIMLVMADAAAADNVVTLTVAPVLPAPLTAGTVVYPIWTADLALRAMVVDGGRQLQDGTLVEKRNFRITVAAFDLGGIEPQPQWRVLLPGGEYTIVAVNPVLADGVAATYDLIAR